MKLNIKTKNTIMEFGISNKKKSNKLKDKVMTSLAIAVIIHGAATGKLFGND